VKRERYYIGTANPHTARDAETRWSRWEKRCLEARCAGGTLSEKRVVALIRRQRDSA
jgi:hypothetical protein